MATMKEVLTALAASAATRQKIAAKGGEAGATIVALCEKNGVVGEEAEGLRRVTAEAPGVLTSFLHNGGEVEIAALLAAILTPAPPAAPKPPKEKKPDEVVFRLSDRGNPAAERRLYEAVRRVAREQVSYHNLSFIDQKGVGCAIANTVKKILSPRSEAERWDSEEVLLSRLEAFVGVAVLRLKTRQVASEQEKMANAAVALAFGETRRLPQETWRALLYAAGAPAVTVEALAEDLKAGYFGPDEGSDNNGNDHAPAAEEATAEDIAAQKAAEAAQKPPTVAEAAVVTT